MSKIKVTLKIQGFELEVEGDRQSVPEILGAVQREIGNQLSLPQALVDGQQPSQPVEKNLTSPEAYDEPTKKRKQKSKRAKSESSEEPPLDFQHDAANWGTPLQNWTTAQKSIWLLYVVESQGVAAEMSAPQIAATFNKHFRHANPINAGYITRDLVREKGNLVGEDTSKDPSAWFLTQSGKTAAEQLVTQAKGMPAGQIA